jgi:FtsP/CotA-like multicopper oxidase with cupredoxin domain
MQALIYDSKTWGSRSIEDSNVYGDPPPGGVTRRYTFNITRSFLAPDGVNTSMTVVNGAYPGPTIQANWGDTFEVTVYNHISGAVGGTSIHWQ